jgi:hypothetical protein
MLAEVTWAQEADTAAKAACVVTTLTA